MKNKKFNGQRLKEALQFREMRMADLSRGIEISRQLISLYVNNDTTPSFENVNKIAKYLNFPIDFFMTEDKKFISTYNTYFRSQATARKKAQESQKIKLEYIAKMYGVLMEYIEFPNADIPIDNPFNRKIQEAHKFSADSLQNEIESLAHYVREYWGLGEKPIDHLQYFLATKGIIIAGFNNVDSKIDAFSQKFYLKGVGEIYIIALAVGEKSESRLLFDIAHELGHILMHEWHGDNEIFSREEFNNLERQANMFASAFLLPKSSFKYDVAPYATNVSYYIELKKKWHVSMQAMTYRARQLELITENQFSYMMRTISSNGWRMQEPGDVIGELEPTIFHSAIDALIDGGYFTKQELLEEFRGAGIWLSQKDMEALLYLPLGFFSLTPKVLQFRPKIKNGDR